MKRLIIILLVSLFTFSCVFIRIDDSVDLGGNYRYVQDYPQVILYHKTPKYEGGGINIVPPKVLIYKFNDRYIIAKSQEAEEMTGKTKNGSILYWIIDKEQEGKSVQSLDSLSFYQELGLLGIDLHLY